MFSTVSSQSSQERGGYEAGRWGEKGGFWAGKNRVLGTLALGMPLHDKIMEFAVSARQAKIEMVTTNGTGTCTRTETWTGSGLGITWAVTGAGLGPLFFLGREEEQQQQQQQQSRAGQGRDQIQVGKWHLS